jgi:hypothetical protein
MIWQPASVIPGIIPCKFILGLTKDKLVLQ